jgi:hypothetical protein
MRFVIVVILVACGGGAAQKAAPANAEPRGSLRSSRVALTTRAALAPHDGTVVEIEGMYTVTDIGPYKLAYERPDGTLATTKLVAGIRLDDNTLISIGARTPEEHALAGRRVRASGTIQMAWPPRQDRDVAQPDPRPWLVKITQLAAI